MGQQPSGVDLSTINLSALAEQRDRDVTALEQQLETKRAAYEADVAELKASIAAKKVEARECRRAADRLARLTGRTAPARRAPRAAVSRDPKAPGLEEQIRAFLADSKGTLTMGDVAEHLERDQATIARCIGRMAGRGVVVRDGDAVRLGAKGKKRR